MMEPQLRGLLGRPLSRATTIEAGLNCPLDNPAHRR
jgi:hypothetical protein